MGSDFKENKNLVSGRKTDIIKKRFQFARNEKPNNRQSCVLLPTSLEMDSSKQLLDLRVKYISGQISRTNYQSARAVMMKSPARAKRLIPVYVYAVMLVAIALMTGYAACL